MHFLGFFYYFPFYLISDVDPAALLSVVNFFYSGLLRVDASNVCAVAAVADILLLQETKEAIAKYIVQTVKVTILLFQERLKCIQSQPQ